MNGTSLIRRYANRIMTENTQRGYNMAAFTSSYRSTGRSQRGSEPVRRRIRCGHTKVRMSDAGAEIPADIERCG